MGFLTDPKTGRRMNADQFIAREKKEWGEALGVFAKECLGFGAKQGVDFFVTTEGEIRKMLNSPYNRRRR